MKTFTSLVAALVLTAFSASAQTNTNQVTFRVLPTSAANTKHSERWSLMVEMAFLNPVRQWGNEIVDLRAARNTYEAGESEVGGFYLRCGKVLSVTPDGVLITLDSRFWPEPYLKTVFLYRCPFKGSVVDDSHMAAIGKPMSPYQYKAFGGAVRTVEAFDCGEVPEKQYVEKLDAFAKAEAERIFAQRRDAQAKYLADKKAADDQRLAAAKARAEKFRAERAAKEAAEARAKEKPEAPK